MAHLFFLAVVVAVNWETVPDLIRLYVRGHGALVTAQVDGKDVRHRDSRSRGYDVYYLHYSYSFEGLTLSDEQRVVAQTYSLTESGQKLPARAMHLWRWTICTALVEEPTSLARVLIMSAVMNGALIAIFLVSRIRLRLKWQLLRDGTVVAGAVLSHRETRSRSPNYYITLGFNTTDGTQTHSEMRVNGKSYFKAYVGSPVTVLYDPMKPKRCVAYEYCDYEVVPLVR